MVIDATIFENPTSVYLMKIRNFYLATIVARHSNIIFHFRLKPKLYMNAGATIHENDKIMLRKTTEKFDIIP